MYFLGARIVGIADPLSDETRPKALLSSPLFFLIFNERRNFLGLLLPAIPVCLDLVQHLTQKFNFAF